MTGWSFKNIEQHPELARLGLDGSPKGELAQIDVACAEIMAGCERWLAQLAATAEDGVVPAGINDLYKSLAVASIAAMRLKMDLRLGSDG